MRTHPLLGLIAALAILIGCSGTIQKREVVRAPLSRTLMRTGVMLKKMGEKPSISMETLPATNGTTRAFLIRSALGEFRIQSVGSNRTAITIRCQGEKRATALLSFINQSDFSSQPLNTGDNTRPLPGLYALHFLAPSFSSIYAGYRNPFSSRKNIWLHFLLHLGVDTLGTTAAATEGYRKAFRFNTGTFAFLLLHRLITLPALTIETDLYNRSVRAGYAVRF